LAFPLAQDLKQLAQMPKEQPHLSTAATEDISISVKNLTAVKTYIVLCRVADSAASGTVAWLYNP